MGFGAGHGCSPAAEDHALVAVHQHAVLDMPAHRARQHHAFDVAADGGEVLGRHRVVHALHVLLDDRAFVEVGGDVVRGGADQLDTARMRLEVGLRALEAGQEAVVDVDGAALQRAAELGAQDLHVARQHHQVDALAFDQASISLLLRALGRRIAARGQRQVVEGHAVAAAPASAKSGWLETMPAMSTAQLAAVPAEQQVVQAMAVLADQQQQARACAAGVQLQLHAELLRACARTASAAPPSLARCGGASKCTRMKNRPVASSPCRSPNCCESMMLQPAWYSRPDTA